jgi:hypothetical protein
VIAAVVGYRLEAARLNFKRHRLRSVEVAGGRAEIWARKQHIFVDILTDANKIIGAVDVR